METSEKETKEIKWGGIINELLWTCSGADKRILRQCPTDYAKYAGIGGTILFTALMAMLSGGYAVYKVFANIPKNAPIDFIDTRAQVFAIGFGIFWGLLIFNLDRFMVNTMYSDGTPKITKEELRGGMPRIILAIFLGIVISTPIEMRIFQDQIKIVVDQNQLKVEQSSNSSNVGKQEKIDAANAELSELRQKSKKAWDAYNVEVNGTGGSKHVGEGPIAKGLKKQAEIADDEFNDAKSRLQPQIDTWSKEISNKEKQSKASASGLNGFAAELDALYSMKGITLFMARMLVTLLFITIEVVPTLFKMMMSSGPYDDLRRAEMHRARVLSDKTISDINDQVNTMVKISVAKNKSKLEAEQAANKDLLNRIAMAQSELLQTAIDEWKAEEMKKVKANPSAYIKTSTSKSEPEA